MDKWQNRLYAEHYEDSPFKAKIKTYIVKKINNLDEQDNSISDLTNQLHKLLSTLNKFVEIGKIEKQLEVSNKKNIHKKGHLLNYSTNNTILQTFEKIFAIGLSDVGLNEIDETIQIVNELIIVLNDSNRYKSLRIDLGFKTEHLRLMSKLAIDVKQLSDEFLEGRGDSYAMCVGYSNLLINIGEHIRLMPFLDSIIKEISRLIGDLESNNQLDKQITNEDILKVIPTYISALDQLGKNTNKQNIYFPADWGEKDLVLLEKLFLCRFELPNSQGLVFGQPFKNTFIYKHTTNKSQNVLHGIPMPLQIYAVNYVLDNYLLTLRKNEVSLSEDETNLLFEQISFYTGRIKPGKIDLTKSNHTEGTNNTSINLIGTSLASIYYHLKQKCSSPTKDQNTDLFLSESHLFNKGHIRIIYHPSTHTDLKGEYGFSSEKLPVETIRSFSKHLDDFPEITLNSPFILSDYGYCLETSYLITSKQAEKKRLASIVLTYHNALKNPKKRTSERQKMSTKEKRAKDSHKDLLFLLRKLISYPFSDKKNPITLVIHGSTGATLSYLFNDESITKEQIGQFGNPIYAKENNIYYKTLSVSYDTIADFL